MSRHIYINSQAKWLLHFEKTNAGSNSSVILARCGLISRPLCEKTRSTGAELAGAHCTRSNSGCRVANSFWQIIVRLLSVESNGHVLALYSQRHVSRPRWEILALRPSSRPRLPVTATLGCNCHSADRPCGGCRILFNPRSEVANFWRCRCRHYVVVIG